ncbi:hypothetical protein BEL04_08190 [Mucilaginibacter sp. PPCGB 2223]|uniref:hypothetical protein n=1 Tax=Mucilaginibacter sp. PPCGB 2223 TaxID=1886027 RepID=UPI0008262103|nr:hypothetical protein [Mucilaginibacter sp. PPCGB 2223]OCX54228.1 hypothetical protein BEL04_08190 [Mucilaginibacter sp. PPCGB 2223]
MEKTLFIKLTLLVSGLSLRYWIGRRRFNRRNFAGLQVYRSYLVAVLVQLLESLLNIAGMLLILTAIYLLIF